MNTRITPLLMSVYMKFRWSKLRGVWVRIKVLIGDFTRAIHVTTTVGQVSLMRWGLPAIEVYKVGDVYYVKDGHHRVSVAHAIRQTYIDAHITEVLQAL